VTHSNHQSFVNRRVLKLNVGFLLAQSAGYQRIIELDLPCVRLEDDLVLNYLQGDLRLSRNSRGILAQGVFRTGVVGECVRCLTPTLVPVEFEIEELFTSPPTADAAYSVDDTGILDLAPLFREETILAVPMGVLCRPDCAGLCPECGQNLNEGVCDCASNEIDPRLKVLGMLRGDEGDPSST
jgi:uncharacterized protein